MRAWCYLGLFKLWVFSTLATAQSVASLPLESIGPQHWRIPAGVYVGQFIINEAGQYDCAKGAVFDGGGQGSALTITIAEVRLDGCEIRNWGRNLTDLDSGIFLSPEARHAQIIDNTFKGAGSGIWVDATKDVVIADNRIEGDESVRSQDRGNGIHLYAVGGALVRNNTVWHTRDGIYIDTSNHNTLEGNELRDLRYGIHYMFSNHNKVINNTTRGTRTGYALMQSHHLTVQGNRSLDDQNYGILMNYITYSTIDNNHVDGVKQGSSGDTMISGAEGKALFIYNSLFNTMQNNRLENSSLGIHLTAGSEDNRISRNAFINNQQQVKYVAIRLQEWSIEGEGNFWSDYLGWDRDSNGIGDVAYEPNDNIDRLLWTYPEVRLLMHSPAIQLLRWVQEAFPVVKSPGVKDSYPLMQLPTIQSGAGNLASSETRQ